MSRRFGRNKALAQLLHLPQGLGAIWLVNIPGNERMVFIPFLLFQIACTTASWAEPESTKSSSKKPADRYTRLSDLQINRNVYPGQHIDEHIDGEFIDLAGD